MNMTLTWVYNKLHTWITNTYIVPSFFKALHRNEVILFIMILGTFIFYNCSHRFMRQTFSKSVLHSRSCYRALVRYARVFVEFAQALKNTFNKNLQIKYTSFLSVYQRLLFGYPYRNWGRKYLPSYNLWIVTGYHQMGNYHSSQVLQHLVRICYWLSVELL